MRIKRPRDADVQPSLVPMVDLLSNTVGALVFIMIFTVIAASGVVVLKRLPLEHSSSAEPINFLCEKDRVIRLDNRDLEAKLKRKWGSPYSLFDVYSWIARFDGIEVEDEYFIARGESSVSYSSYSFSILFIPKVGTGESKGSLQNPVSNFRRQLRRISNQKQFVHFFVRPDSIDTFLAARSVAADEMGLRTGWMPLDTTDQLRFVTKGRAATEQ